MNRIDQTHPDAPDLAGYGPLPVGAQTLHLVNPGQIDVLRSQRRTRRADRPLTVELWYPAMPGTPAGTLYRALLRDGHRRVDVVGQACRDAAQASGDFPLVILSHGYPGDRLLMSHFGEKLASRGYVVAGIDHRDSTYDDKQAFASTLVNRPKDTRFVRGALSGRADAGRTAIIGYSMGGYGALVAAGAAVSPAALSLDGAPRAALWAEAMAPAADPELKAIIPIGPWGRQHGLWDASGMAGLRVPMLLMAGSADDVSGYDTGMRRIFEEAVGVPRHLLTFQGAGHNAAAPYPAPAEAFDPSPHLDFLPAEHHVDPVWDTVLMNSVAQHFALAFLDLHLKGDTSRAACLADPQAGSAPRLNPGLTLESLMPHRP